MVIKKTKLLSVFAMGMATSFSSAALGWFDCASPYIGIAAKVDRIHLKEQYGNPLFKRKLPSGGIFAGVQLNENFGVELGYDRSERSNRTREIKEGGTVPGGVAFLGAGEFFRYRTKFSMDTVYAGVTGRYGLDCAGTPNSFLFGMVGAAFVRVKASQLLIETDFGVPTSVEVAKASFNYKNSKRKVVPKLMLGLEHLITDNIGVRLFANWTGTSSLKNLHTTINPLNRAQLRFKDTLGYGLGLKYSF